MQTAPPARPAISAHRCGAGSRRDLENTRAALDAALALECEYVEFDVRQLGDGTFVLNHDAQVEVAGERRPVGALSYGEFAAAGEHFLRYDEVLQSLAAAGKSAHIDLKFVSPEDAYADPASTAEVAAVELALATLGAEQMVVTTHEDRSALALTTWAREQGIELHVGLSLGFNMRDEAWWRACRGILDELFPRRRYEQTGANVVVSNHIYARLTNLRFARRRGLPLLVWTVDTDRDLGYWLTPGRAWIVTTNHPARALELARRRA